MFESFLRYIIIIYSARFLGRFGFRDVICYFPRLLPLSFVSKGRPKGKRTTPHGSGGKKKRIRKALQKRSTFCKTLNIEERFFFLSFFLCVVASYRLVKRWC